MFYTSVNANTYLWAGVPPGAVLPLYTGSDVTVAPGDVLTLPYHAAYLCAGVPPGAVLPLYTGSDITVAPGGVPGARARGADADPRRVPAAAPHHVGRHVPGGARRAPARCVSQGDCYSAACTIQFAQVFSGQFL